MLFSAVFFASVSLLSFVSASPEAFRRQLAGFPPCASPCLNEPANPGGCLITDEACLCKSIPFLTSTLLCIYASCPDTNDQQNAVNGADSLCADFGVNLSSESSAIAVALSTMSASGTGAPSANATTSPSPTAPASSPTSSTGAAHSLFTGPTFASLVSVVVAAALFVL